MPNNFYGGAALNPFLPASVIPFAQIQGPPMQPYNQLFHRPVIPPPLSSLPHSHPQIPPQRPLPKTQPPLVPPPPWYPRPPPPPPRPIQESVNMEFSSQSVQFQWQGSLCKSGVNSFTIYAWRADSNICSYTNAILEPAEWPTKLDMTEYTDFQHVISTFAATSPNRMSCQISLGFPSHPSHLMLTVS